MKRVCFWLLGIFGLLGLAICIKAMLMSLDCYSGKTVSALCAVATGDATSCSPAICGKWGKIFGVSNGTWGTVYHMLFLWLWISAAVDKARREKLLSLLFFVALFGFVYAIFMATLLTFVIKVPCGVCIAFYITAIVNLLLAFGATLKSERFKTAVSVVFEVLQNKRYWAVFTSWVVVSVAVIAGMNWLEHKAFIQAAQAQAKQIAKQQAKITEFDTKPLPQDEVSKQWFVYLSPPIKKKYRPTNTGLEYGADNPKVVIYEFTDFMCPFCRRMEHFLNEMTDDFSDIKIVRKDYPLDHECNPLLGGRPFHIGACRAAYFARCAQKAGASYWQVHNLLYENQRKLSEIDTLKDIAKKVGINWDKVKKCMEDTTNEVHALVAKDIKEGNDLMIEGTPTLIINNRMVMLPAGPQEIKQLIRILKGEKAEYPPPLTPEMKKMLEKKK